MLNHTSASPWTQVSVKWAIERVFDLRIGQFKAPIVLVVVSVSINVGST